MCILLLITHISPSVLNGLVQTDADAAPPPVHDCFNMIPKQNRDEREMPLP
jgi:hypothetical protein